jgi:hypothetical protein
MPTLPLLILLQVFESNNSIKQFLQNFPFSKQPSKQP